MKFEPLACSEEWIKRYEDLFRACFPSATHLNREYLTWLYTGNPAGEMLGFNAWDEDEQRVAAHYACLPCNLVLSGEPVRGLLAVLSATHPAYQGQGLFPKLAGLTYEHLESERYACVYGVGNALSTPPLVNKVGFQLVSQLDARVCLLAPKIDLPAAREAAEFYRPWTAAELQWRCDNVANRARLATNPAGQVLIRAPSLSSLLPVSAPVPGDQLTAEHSASNLLPSLYMGLVPRGAGRFPLSIRIPERLKPSPLNLVYKPLATTLRTVNPERVLFGFQDFDAY